MAYHAYQTTGRELVRYDPAARLALVTSHISISTPRMTTVMNNYAVDCIAWAYREYSNHNEQAAYIRDKFDTTYGGEWNCVVSGGHGVSYTCIQGYAIRCRNRTDRITLWKSKNRVRPTAEASTVSLSTRGKSKKREKDAIKYINEAYRESCNYSEIAKYIRRRITNEYRGIWCCAAGKTGQYQTSFSQGQYIDYMSFSKGGDCIQLRQLS